MQLPLLLCGCGKAAQLGGGGNSETTGEGATLSAHSPLLHSPPQGTFLVQQHQEDLKGDVPPPSFIP